MVHRTGASAGSYDSPPASQPEMLKQENADVGHGNQYMFQSSTSGGYTFENAQELNAALNNSQMNSQMQNLAPFSNVMPIICYTLSCFYEIKDVFNKRNRPKTIENTKFI